MKTNIIKVIFLLTTAIFGAVLLSCSTDGSAESTPPTAETPGNNDDPNAPGSEEGDPLPDPDKNPDAYFSALSGYWTISGTDWLYYDTENKEWKEGGEDPGYEGKIMGDAVNRMFFGFGFWDPAFGFMAEDSDDTRMTIPIDPVYNPIARVMSGSGTYLLFLTLHDYDAGYFYPVGNELEVEISEDFERLTIPSVEGTVTKDGQPIETHYTYLALIGVNESSGSYTMFSNWRFAKNATLNRKEPTRSGNEAAGFCIEPYYKGLSAWKAERFSGIRLPDSAFKVTETTAIEDVETIWFYR